MRVLTFCVLAVTLCTFVYLAYDSSLETVTVTEIKTADLTGKQGWEECSMISKVTDAYSDSATAGAFNLINVMESKSECTTNLAETSPCAASFGGGVAGVAITDYNIKGMGIDAAGALYFVSLSATVADLYTLYKFDPSSGTITTITDSNTWGILATVWTQNRYGNIYSFSPQSLQSVTVQISSSGVVFLMQTPANFLQGDRTLYWFDPSTSTSSSYTNLGWFIHYDYGTFPRSFALDSEDGVWVMLATYDANFWNNIQSDLFFNSTLDIYKFDSLTPSASMTLKFSTAVNHYGLGYNGLGDPSVFNEYEANPLSFDASGNLWALWWTADKYIEAGGGNTYEYKATLNKIGASSSTPAASVVLFDNSALSLDLTIAYASGEYVLRTSGVLEKYDSSAALVSTHTVSDTSSATSAATDSSGNILFAKPAGLSNINKLVSSSTAATSLKSYAGGASEWFVCGGTKQTTVPGSVQELNTACALNGVKWSANTAGGDTFFSDDEYAALASTCDSTLYTRICDVVGELPPYICTKEEPASVTVYLGVAAANSELLYVSLIFFCGFVFDAISHRHRAKEEEGNGDGEAGAEEEATGVGEVELAPATSLGRKASPLFTANNNTALEKKVATMKKDAVAAKKKIDVMGEEMKKEAIAAKNAAITMKKKVDMMEKEAISINKKFGVMEKQLAALLSTQGSQL